jgi:hypothetical protein
MAIPAGTTSRQLNAVARWALAALIVAVMLACWRPGYRPWGAVAAGILLLFILHLARRAHAGDRTVPGHPVHLALLGPAVVLAYHLAARAAAPQPHLKGAVAGAIELSMVFQLALLAAGVMLTQGLLPAARTRAAVPSVCGLAMMGGAAAAILSGHAAAGRSAAALVGFAGVCVWLAPLWASSARGGESVGGGDAGRRALRRPVVRAAYVVVATAPAAVIAWASPHEFLLAVGVTGASLVLGGCVFRRGRVAMLAGGGAAAAAAAVAEALVHRGACSFARIPPLWLGRGEEAFAHLYLGAADSGAAVLGEVVGKAGMLWLLVGLGACLVWLLVSAGRAAENKSAAHADSASRGRAILWTAATVLATCALLAPGGPFIPAVTLAAAFTWGLLPTMLARPARPRPAALAVAAVVAVLLLLGLGRGSGLAYWSAGAYGLGEGFLHGVAGLVLAMTLAWALGSRRAWLGVAGVALAIAAGGAGEWVQGIITDRRAELADWLAHALGGGVAAAVYLLAVGARWCESADAAPRGGRAKAQKAWT